MTDITLYPGAHIITFVPGAATYYVEFTLPQEGVATLTDFQALPPGLFELPTPWGEADLASLRYEQSADIIWWYARAHQTRVLERRSATSWGLRLFDNQDGPFETLQDSGVSLSPSGRTGVVTLTASGPVFRTEDVGGLIKLVHQGEFRTATLDSAGDVTDPIRVTSVEGNRAFSYEIAGTFVGTVVLQRSIGSDIAWADFQTFTAPASGSINDGLANQIVYYRLRMSAHTSGAATASLTYSLGITEGVGRIHAVTADNAVTVDVLAPFGAVSATAEWALGSWSLRYGWPSAGTVHDGRHWIARDDRLWGSASDDYVSFAVGALDADAIGRRMATGEINLARWLESAGRLLIGTSGAEIEVRSTQLEEPVTPTNMAIRGRSTRGSAATQAAKLDDDVLFVSRSRRRLYRLAFDSDQQGYEPLDLTRLHKDVAGTGAGFVEIAVQIEPEPRVWCVRADGQIAVLLMEPAETVYAWSRIVTDGAFESVCVVPGTPEDQVYAVVRRTINGVTKRYVEKFAAELWTDSREAWRVHSGLRYSGAPVSTFSGLGHLEGKTVQVWADGRAQAPQVVAGGQITLERAASVVIAGLPYQGRYRSPKLAFGATAGSALTQDKKVNRLGLLVHRTPGGCVAWGRDFSNVTRLPSHRQGDLMDAPLNLWTEDIRSPFEGETALDPRLCILMDQPGPAEVLGVVPTVETHERA